MKKKDRIEALERAMTAEQIATQGCAQAMDGLRERINRRRDETLGLATDLREADDRLTETQDALNARVGVLEMAGDGAAETMEKINHRVKRLETAGTQPNGDSMHSQHWDRINVLQDRLSKAEAVARTNYTVVQSHSDRLGALEAQAHDPKDVTDAIEGLRGGQDALKERIGDLENRCVPDGRERLERLESLLDVKKDEFGAWGAAAVGDLHERIRALENADDADGERIRQMQADLAGCKQLNEDIAGERDLLARKLRERTQERDDARANLERAKTHWSSCARDLDKAKRDLEDERGRTATMSEQATKLSRTIDKVAREREVLRDEMDHAHASVSALTRRIAEMEAALLAVGNAARIGTAHSLARACLGLVNGDEAVRIPDEKGRSS